VLSTGPYFPPDYNGSTPPPVHPAQPGVLLIMGALALVIGLVAREIFRRRARGTHRVVDELTVTWLPADAIELARALGDLDVDGEQGGEQCVWTETEELTFGPIRRPPRTARQRSPS
jgi:hypothetical protein